MNASSADERRAHLRARILRDHLREIARVHSDQDLENALTLESTISLLSAPLPSDENISSSVENISLLPGALTESDLRRFSATPSLDITSETQARLSDALDATLLKISQFYHADDTSDLQRAREIPEELAAQFDNIRACKTEVEDRRARICALVGQIDRIHPALQDKLTHALRTYPPHILAKHTAEAALAATAIETALLKLSLLRARVRAEVYSLTVPGDTASRGAEKTDKNMQNALISASEKLAADERRLREEEREVDRELAEYRKVMDVVDGEGRGSRAKGGYAQVVDDWTRVQKETEECRRDLRRLGWTGD
ncbi:hypothetical protein PLICRDRAFT_255686 [Plicaturopsis crispa FD-325 SS-3]|nr:hypothetical protein PLICRDRAFT_255686 [Plicaturopsis crispa FD-325 SS-3]